MRIDHSFSAPPWALVVRLGSCPTDRTFGDEANPYLMASAPGALSIGARCLEKGYEFHWAPYSGAPAMTRPRGHLAKLTVRDGCPDLDDDDGKEFSQRRLSRPRAGRQSNCSA